MLKHAKRWLAGLAAATMAVAAFAQAPVEVPFFYPVAVGGPITKTIDGYAASLKDAPLQPI